MIESLKNIELKNILFLDIEPVPLVENFDELPEIHKKHWEKKASFLKNDEDLSPSELFDTRAGIYSEFGKVVCISVGFVYEKDGKKKIRLKSFFGDNEKLILEEFGKLLTKEYSGEKKYLCAHNGKEFDFPFIARRMLINGIELPPALDIHGKKPWETNFLDTMELWKFGDYKHFVSLELLAQLFGIPTPKDDIDGSQVAHVYYKERDLDRIAVYCQKDVATTINLFLRYRGEPIIDEKNWEIA